MATTGEKRPRSRDDEPDNAPGPASKRSRGEAPAERDDDVVVVGLDWGSTFSAMVVKTEKGAWHPVNDYEDAPVIYGGRAKDISEVPSLISVSRGPEYTHGYTARGVRGSKMSNLKSMMPHITDQSSAEEVGTKAKDQTSTAKGNQITDDTFADLRARTTETLNDLNLAAPDVIVKILKYFHAHLEAWCESRNLRLLSTYKTMASHPVYWKAATIIEYQKLLEAAGFNDVHMVNEGEAAANTVLADLAISDPENLLFCDLGGETWEFVFYRVHRVGDVTVKDEIIPCGKGGMAVVDDLAQVYFTEEFQGSAEKVSKHTQEFSLRKMGYNPSVAEDLEIQTADGPAITVSGASMHCFYEVALEPMLKTLKSLRKTLERLRIRKAYLVGGTSESEHWLRPHIEDALGEDMEIKYSTHPQCTLVAKGAMLAGSEDHVTSSRLNELHLGHLVSRSRGEVFSDETLWGPPELGPAGKNVVEVIQVLKPKGKPLFTDSTKAPWHWLVIENLANTNFKQVLENTQVQIFASEKEKPRISRATDFEPVSPRVDFHLGIEPRHVFNHEEIGKFLKVLKSKKGKTRWEFYYAIKAVCDGVGIRLLVGYQADMTKEENGIKMKDLGLVRWVVSQQE